MTNQSFNNVTNLYGSPSGFSKDRRKAYFVLDKEPSIVNKELASVEEDVDVNFYVLGYESSTIISMDL